MPDRLDLTAAQAGVWFAQQLDPGPAFTTAACVDIDGDVDPQLFAAALRRTLADAQALRIRITGPADAPRQEIVDEPEWRLTLLDLDDTAAQEWITADLATPIDLATGPVFAEALIRRGPGRWTWYQRCHHIVMDAYTSALVAQRVAAVYTALATGTPVPASPFGALADVVAEDAAYRGSARHDADRDFWRRHLAGVEVPDLASGPTRPGPTFRRRRLTLPAPVGRGLAAAGGAAGATRVEAVLATTALYVQRLTGAAEAVLGLPMMGRLGSVAARVPVTAVNVLPLRVPVAATDTLAGLVGRVAAQIRAIRPHQRYRGEDIRRDLGLVGGDRRLVGPWVNIKPFGATLNFAGLPGTPRYVSAGPVDDLSITLDDRGGDVLDLCLDANPARYAESDLDGHVERLAGLLRAVAGTGGSTRTGRLGLAERPTGDDTARPLPPAGLVDLWAEQVRRTPDGTALIGPDGARLSYAALARRVDDLAALLAGRGARPGRTVAVCLPRGADLLVTLLAVQRTGAAYLPLDPDFPAERLGWMLADSAPALLVTGAGLAVPPAAAPAGGASRDDAPLGDAPLGDAPAGDAPAGDAPAGDAPAGDAPAGAVPAGGVPVLRLDGDLDGPRRRPEPGNAPHEAAYLLYTSGSTGRPKGVVVTRQNLVNFLLAMRELVPLGPADRLLAVTTVSFDISGLELYLPLLSGAAVVLAARDAVRDPDALAALVRDTGATVIQATPTLYRALLDRPGGGPALAGLRVLVGGEALPPELAAELRRHAAELTNLYGPTETTIWSTAHRLPAAGDPASADDPPAGGVASATERISVGRPIWNTRAYVLDAALRPVPDGFPGELYLGGAGLARGYLNQPGLTAGRFTADPYAPGERMYRTGDLARRLPDGTLDLLGRVDHQVKLRGFRIELGEIEAVLAADDAVRQAVAVIREDRPGDRRLVAYVTGDADPAALRRRAAAALPDYMTPAAIVPLAELPSTPNGKLDRAALPAPDHCTGTPEAVRTPQQELLAGVFAEVLGVPSVGPHDDFFALGGHSLLAARVAARVRGIFGGDLALRDVFDAPSVAALAARLETAASADAAPDTAGPARRSLRPVPGLRVSAAQRRLWALHRVNGPDASYNLPLLLDLDGPLDLAALRAALDDLVARHEPLRTVLVERDGEPHPVPGDARVHLEVAAGDPRQAIRKPFDLASEPPLRARLYRVGPGRHALLLVVHHIAGDEWSLTPLLDDLATAYAARCAGSAPAWPPLPVRYADYAAWHDALPMEAHLAYWRAALAGAPAALRLPTDRPRPARASSAGGMLTFPIAPELERAVRETARRHGVTVFMTLQAAVAALLHRMGAGTDIPLGSPVAGRGDEALDRLVGFFVNTVVLRTDVSGDPTFAELLARVRDTDLAALAHQDLPFERLVEDLNPHRTLAHHPLFQVMVSYQAPLPRVAGFPQVRVTPRLVATGTAKFDLSFDLAERDGGLEGSLEYRTDLFDAGTAEALTGRLVRLLTAATAGPDRPISAIDLLTPAERAAAYGPRRDLAPATLGRLFAERVAADPAAVAVQDGERTLTYGALDALANRLARRLRAEGAGPERIVAVLLPRSADLVVTLLAVARSGAAYLPLDVRHPADRIAYQLADARPVLLVSDRPAPAPAGPAIQAGTGPAAGTNSAVEAGSAAGVRRISPDDLDDDPTDPRVPIDPAHPAYVIYTSGSTGAPKGVVVPHAGLAALVASVGETFGTGPGSRVAQFVSPAVDVAISEIAASVLSGGTLVVVPEPARLGDALGEFVTRHRLTHLDLPPALLAALPPAAIPAGVTITIGGEASSAELVRRWGRGRRLVNAYGPTEATVTATSWVADGDGPVLIGTPEINRSAHVLDDRLRPVPPGVPGELYLGADGLARGYLNRPALTAQRFVADPFGSPGAGSGSPGSSGSSGSGSPGARLYRTGDLVRRTAAGDLEFLGRTDDQVQIRGFRVEPAEVEAVLATHPAVGQVVVVARDARLVAYVVPARPVRPDDLREHAAAVLPAPLVPAVELLDALPLAATGKVDKARLPDPAPAAPATEAPAGPVERTLAGIVAGVLGRDPDTIGRHDGFFALGGDSILAIQLASRARSAGLLIAPRQVFEQQSVAELARVAEPVGAAGTDPAGPAGPATAAGDAPETPIIAWLRELDAPTARYSQAILLRTPAGIDRAEVARVLRTGLAPHPVLWARLVTGADRWRLAVPADPGEVPLRVVGADADLAAEREAAADRLDPAAGLLVQAVWADRGGEPGRLLLVVHHLVVDGVSWRILVEDLAAAARGDRPAVPGTPLRAWAAGLAAALPERAGEREYWRRMLAGPATRLGTAALDPARDTAGTLRRVEVTVDAAVTGPLLTTVPETFRAGVQDVLLAGLSLALARRTGSGAEPLIALEGHGRQEQVVPGADLLRTVGWFTSEHPVRLPAAAQGVAAVVRGVRDRLRAVPDGGIGYGMLRYLGEPGTLPRTEPEVLFNYLGRFTGDGGPHADWTIAPELPAAHASADPAMPVRHRVAVNAAVAETTAGPVLRAEFSYPAAALADADARRLADDWLAALVAIRAASTEPDAGALTPADVPLAGLDQADLAELHARYGPGLVDVLPLAPLQEGLLYLAGLDPATDVYTVQQVFTLTGAVDAGRLRAAADDLLDRYPNLRGGFVRTGSGRAVQAVPATVDVPFTEVDLTDRPGDLAALLDTQRRLPFDLADPPLLRFVLVRLGEREYRLVLTQHHLLMDGWSGPLAMRDLFGAYAGRPAPAPRPYADYLAWLRGQDPAAATRAWGRRWPGSRNRPWWPPVRRPSPRCPRSPRSSSPSRTASGSPRPRGRTG
ncbi:non-ribosomal peptide synthetase [Plantactinospora sp. KBS50]|uniref:non-ribosomal peptide synthetase n=1 Tax=Plantactinospora sp. KBS50 TaxID=2024580 RepID=UPI000BAAEDD0|nr:non-ribosomal peptide synthetase [Plantactinospora sp. KBS50]ASW55467.1 hypothetical protein CIK06_16745 [Plantactinospora sp. KBS50]